MNDVVYFSLNDWFCGRDYPKDGCLKQFVESYKFSDDAWCKENRLCVLCGNVDMSVNWCITASREWVEENCPELLGKDGYTYSLLYHDKNGTHEKKYERSYSDFVCHEDEEGAVYDRFDWPFLEYDPENFGTTYYDYVG